MPGDTCCPVVVTTLTVGSVAGSAAPVAPVAAPDVVAPVVTSPARTTATTKASPSPRAGSTTVSR